MPEKPSAIEAAAAPERTKKSNYPEPFASRVSTRGKRPLGDLFGLSKFGVNLTRLPPGAETALHHVHARQDEFVYVLEGSPTLYTDQGRAELRPGMCAGFPAGGTPHHLANESNEDVVILEIGDRTPDDTVSYPDDDLVARRTPEGGWTFEHKDGRPY